MYESHDGGNGGGGDNGGDGGDGEDEDEFAARGRKAKALKKRTVKGKASGGLPAAAGARKSGGGQSPRGSGK
eukprot:54099-Prymnesium_polylepis.1